MQTRNGAVLIAAEVLDAFVAKRARDEKRSMSTADTAARLGVAQREVQRLVEVGLLDIVDRWEHRRYQTLRVTRQSIIRLENLRRRGGLRRRVSRAVDLEFEMSAPDSGDLTW